MDINLPEANWLGEKVSGADLARLLKENKGNSTYSHNYFDSLCDEKRTGRNSQ